MMNETFEKLQSMLAALYQASAAEIQRHFVGESWSMEGEASFLNLAMLRTARSKRIISRHDEKKSLCLEDLTNPLTREFSSTCSKIWVTGPAGSGKSTLCQRIAYDWARAQRPSLSAASSSVSCTSSSMSRVENGLTDQTSSSPFYLRNIEREPYALVLWIKLSDLSAHLNLEDIADESKPTKKRIASNRLPYDEYGLDVKAALANYVKTCLLRSQSNELSEECLAECLKQNTDSIFYLLDGYNEVAGLTEQPIMQLLTPFLNQSNHYLITLRPQLNFLQIFFSETKPPGFCHVEVLGFKRNEVLAYVDRHFKARQDHRGYHQLKGWLTQDSSLMSIAQIPVHLEMLCALVSEDEGHFISDLSQVTVTQIYQQLVLLLLKRYRRRHFAKASIDEQSLLDDSALFSWFKREKLFILLGSLALEGLINREQLFSAEVIKEKARLVHGKQSEAESQILWHRLLQIGILRGLSLDENRSEIQGCAEFLDFTLQEFFAAWFIADLFVTDREVLIDAVKQKVSARPSARLMLRTLIADYKYSSSFSMVWPFVAGLLDLHREREHYLNAFANRLDQPPLEIRGCYHEPLLIECIEQMRRFDQMPASWQRLSQFLVEKLPAHFWDLTSQGRIKEALERSPRWVNAQLTTVWVARSKQARNEKDRWSVLSLVASLRRVVLTPELLDVTARCFKRRNLTSYSAMHATALRFLSCLDASAVTRPFLRYLVKALSTQDLYVRGSAFATLSRLGSSALKEPFLSYLTQALESKEYRTQELALQALSYLGASAARELFLSHLVEALSIPNKAIQKSAFAVLTGLGATVSEEPFFSHVVNGLSSEDVDIQSGALNILGNFRVLLAKEPLLSHLVEMLRRQDEKIQEIALKALECLGASAATEPILSYLASALSSQDERIQSVAFCALVGLSAVATKKLLLSDSVEVLRSQDREIQKTILWALGRPDETSAKAFILSHLAKALSSQEQWIQKNAFKILNKLGEAVAREPFLSFLAKALNSEEWRLQEMALKAICCLGVSATKLPILSHLSEILGSQEWTKDSGAISYFGVSSVKESLFTRLTRILHTQDSVIRKLAFQVLEHLGAPVAKEPFLSQLVRALDSKNREIREAAFSALEELGALAAKEPILSYLAKMLHSRDWVIRQKAFGVLSKLGKSALSYCMIDLLKLSLDEWHIYAIPSFTLECLRSNTIVDSCSFSGRSLSLVYRVHFINPQGEPLENCSLDLSQEQFDEIFLNVASYRKSKQLLPILKERFTHSFSRMDSSSDVDMQGMNTAATGLSGETFSPSSTSVGSVSRIGFYASSLSSSYQPASSEASRSSVDEEEASKLSR